MHACVMSGLCHVSAGGGDEGSQGLAGLPANERPYLKTQGGEHLRNDVGIVLWPPCTCRHAWTHTQKGRNDYTNWKKTENFVLFYLFEKALS